jgi:putative intracellular protease/amidase
MSKTIVIVSTSAAFLKGHPTGLWLEELAAPYYKFKAAGFEVVIASIQGGPVPIDAGSITGDFFTDEAKKFMHDGAAFGQLSHSVALSAIDFNAENIKAIFMCGGHGVEVDFVDNQAMKAAIEKLYASGKIVAAVCHGPVCLAQCNKPDGEPLVKGLEVTGFSNSEENAVGLASKCEWLIQDKFTELGSSYSAADDWNSNVKIAGNLITGQNPQSSAACADAVLSKL